MALRFNPPPNWPKPPEGFIPQPGWQPDPAWGPAPVGWNFWVEEEQSDDATRVLPADGVEEASADEPVEEPVAEPVDEPVEEPTAEEAPATPQADATASFESASQEDPTEAFAPEPIPPQNPYTAAGQANAAPTYTGSYPQNSQPNNYPQYTQGNYPQNDPGSSNQNVAGGFTQTPPPTGNEPAKKSKKILWIVLGGVLAFLLIIVLVISLIVGMLSGSSSSTNASDSSISQQDAGSDTWSDSGSSSSGDFARENTSGETKTYEGEGDKTIDIEKPGGSDSTAWIEYTYDSSDKYDTFRIESQDSSGSANDILVSYYPSDTSENVTGSAFLDGRWSNQDPSTKLEITAEGKWKIVIHPLSDTPVKKVGDTMNGVASQAFIIEGDSVTADVKLEESTRIVHFDLDKLPDNLEEDEIINVFSSEDPGFEGSVKLDSGRHLYQAESSGNAKWEITLK